MDHAFKLHAMQRKSWYSCDCGNSARRSIPANAAFDGV